MLSQRRFGVEIECGHPLGYSHVHTLLNSLGIKPLSVGVDASGVEVRSPILKGASGFEWLERCMTAIREDGGYVQQIDGMHVHHEGVPGYRLLARRPNNIACLRLIHSWKNNAKFIDKFVAERRVGRSTCNKVWDVAAHVKNAEDHGNYPGKYADLNINALKIKGTIEIRLHEGTLDPAEAEAWIRLCQSLLDTAAKSVTPIPKQKNIQAFLDLLLDDDDIKERLLAKAKRGGKPLAAAAFR